MVFKTGAQGTGYYPDGSLLTSPSQLPATAGTIGNTITLALFFSPAFVVGQGIHLV